MGAISVKNFDVSFIFRTKEIIEKYDNYSGELEFTLLINSLVGLLILPKEFSKQKKRKFNYEFLQQRLNKFTLLNSIFTKDVVKIYLESGEAYNQKKFSFKSGINQNEILTPNITVGELLGRIRNGIAHMHITPTQFDGKWDGVIIKNYKWNSTWCNFETYMTYEELRNFALFIAGKYKTSIKL